MLAGVLALAAAATVLTFQDPAITESSGLVALDDGLVVTVNDSGDRGRVFVVDRRGRTVGTTSWPDDPVDVEALAPAGRGEVWVGDTGDNTGSRESITVLRVPVGRGDREVTPPAYRLVYPDGAHDAETLLADPRGGRLLVVTKELLGGSVYAAPRRLRSDRPNRLRRVARSFAFATDGSFFPDGRHYVVRGYGSAAVYTYPGHRRVASFRLPAQPQGEGVAVAADGTLLLSSEGEHAPVLRVRLPRRVVDAITPRPSPTPEPAPHVGEQVTSEPGVALDVDGWPRWAWWVGGGVVAVLAAAFVGALRWLHLRRGQAP